MASYTETIQVTHSEISYPSKIYYDLYEYFTPSKTGPVLYISKQNDANGTWENQILFKWDESAIPDGKHIISSKIHFYVKRGYSELVNGDTLPSGWNERNTGRDGIYLSQDTSRGFLANQYAEVYSHTGNYKPYVVIQYEDVPPRRPSQQFPSNVKLDARTPIKFSWKYSSQDNQVQTRYEIQYSINGQSTWTTVSGTNANEYHDFTADTFPETGTIYWKVRVRDGNNLWSDWSSVYKFNTVVTPQKTPRIISPTSGYLDGSEKIKLSWEFLGGADYDTQGKYELQYSTNGSSWNTINKTTSLQYHEFDKDFFGSGRIEWKVKTFNTFNDVSEFTEIVAFNVISSPPIPQIQNITNSSRPKITWISVEQQYYEIKIYDENDKLIHEHKEPSINKYHDIKIFLDDGDYRAELVVFNQYNLFSQTTTYDFTILTVKPQSPTIDVYSGQHSNTIKGDSNTQITRVYRDNNFIGLLEDNTFVDFTCENKKEYKYHLRSIDNEGNFSDSEIKLGNCSFKNNTISSAKDPGNFINLSYGLNSIPGKKTNKSVIANNLYFDGREYPVTEFTEFKSMIKNLEFFTKNKSDIDRIEGLINKKEILLYRDVEGENIYGTVLSIDYEKVIFGYSFRFTIQKTDYRGDLDD